MIGSHTKLLGVIGWPVEHSRSPVMHNAALASLGLDCVYLACLVAPDRLAEAVRGAAALGVRGLNVTLPHKEAALALCRPDELARAVGAVNTLVFEGGEILGTNTDVHGFRMLCAEVSANVRGKVVVLGAGGAARAVVAALRETAAQLVVVSRSARRVEGAGAARWPTGGGDLHALLAGCDLLVDATPRGLDDATPALDLTALRPGAVVLDLVVRRETALVAAARARGLNTSAGAPMLLHQGAAALERWVGQPAPLAVMRAALESALT